MNLIFPLYFYSLWVKWQQMSLVNYLQIKTKYPWALGRSTNKFSIFQRVKYTWFKTTSSYFDSNLWIPIFLRFEDSSNYHWSSWKVLYHVFIQFILYVVYGALSHLYSVSYFFSSLVSLFWPHLSSLISFLFSSLVSLPYPHFPSLAKCACFHVVCDSTPCKCFLSQWLVMRLSFIRGG